MDSPSTSTQRLLHVRRRLSSDSIGRTADLASSARVRLRIASLVMGGVWTFIVARSSYLFFYGEPPPGLVLPGNLDDIYWTSTTVGLVTIVLSFAVAGATLVARIGERELSILGLIFGVVATFGICMAENQVPLRPDQLGKGVSSSLGWIVFFPLVVPAPPRRAALAVLGAVACTPLSIGLWSLMGLEGWTRITVGIWTAPVVITGLMTIVPIHVIHRLGQRAVDAERKARKMGAYQLEHQLGVGGMGEVWSAEHEFLARPAAVKLVRIEGLTDQTEKVAHTVARFEREARVTASLQSPHTIDLYDFGVTDDGQIFYAMELLRGVDLATLVQIDGPQCAARVIHILRQACASLAEAHGRGLVHRDIKPSNLFVGPYALEHDFVKVLDFGLVKQLTLSEEDDVALTAVGALTGTPAFMAPEIALGADEPDARADIYGLGCVAYWLLTGDFVFAGKTPVQMVIAHANDVPEPPSERTSHPIPPGLDALVLECLAKHPDERPNSAVRLAARLEAIDEQPWTETDAAAWWHEHRPEPHRASSADLPPTLDAPV